MRTGSLKRLSYDNILIIIMIICLVTGIAAGSVYTCIRQRSSDTAGALLLPFYTGTASAEIFINTFISLGLFISASFLCGTWAVSHPFGAVLLLYQGFEAGIKATSDFITYGNDAVRMLILFFLPKALIISVICIFTVREQLSKSSELLRYLLGRNEQCRGIKKYLVRYVLLLLISAIFSGSYSVMMFLAYGT